MFTPPVRKSMTDQELQDALGAAKADEAGIVGAMELLEQQSALREQDNLEFAVWVQELESIGTSEALAAIRNAQPSESKAPLEFSQSIPGDVATSTDEISASLNAFYSGLSVKNPEPEPELELELELEPELEPELASAAPTTQIYPEFEPEPAAEQEASEDEELTSHLAVPEIASSEIATELKDSTRAISQLWAWLSISSGFLPIALAYVLHSMHLDFGQVVAAIVIGFGLSGLTIAASALAGKRSGLPTLFLSRSAFGVYGNYAPGWPIALLRIGLPIVLIAATLSFLIQQPNDEPASTFNWSIDFFTGLGVIALVAVVATYLAVATRSGEKVRFWLTVAMLTSGLVIAANAAASLDISRMNFGSGVNFDLPSIAAGILIFALFGNLWSLLGADSSRILGRQTLGLKTIAWTLLGAAVVPAALTLWYSLVLSGAGVILAEQAETSIRAAANSLGGPLATFLMILSSALWLHASLATAKTSLAAVGISSRGLVLVPLIATVSIVGGSVLWQLMKPTDTWIQLGSLLVVLSVPSAAWAGIFTSDVLLRRIAYHEVSLNRAYGFYKSTNVVNLLAWLLAVILGFGFLVLSTPGFEFFGYLAGQFDAKTAFQDSNLGLLIAFGIGMIAPVAFGIPRIKRQESEVLAIEARRDDLKDIFKFGE